ncbi:MAG: metallophosphoesterase [Candidatus Heimdallarchaeota archaeon]|nr:metallophosphoesterase [Candidatus Heimdallarchaeota archaeon]
MITKKRVIFALFLFIALNLIIFFKSEIILADTSKNLAQNPVEWTPSTPDIGDMITITYDPSAADTAFSSTPTRVYMIWGMHVKGNQNLTGKEFGAVPPSMEMWPVGTVLHDITADRFVKTPMNDVGGIWTISIILNERPDFLVVYFENQNGDRDNNNGNYWLINSLLKTERIRIITPSFAEPLITLNGSEIMIKVDAPVISTEWYITLENVDDLFEPALTTNYDVTNAIWALTFSAPAKLGLYDTNISCKVNGNERFDWEPNSIKLIEEFKAEYKFIILADPQIHRDGSAGYAYRNEESGIGNLTDVLKEVNLLNPEFILVAGDLTEWTDEIALLNFRKWCNLYLENAPVVLTMGNHGDFEGTASSGNYEWGCGKGTWLNIIGSTRGIFYYGSHAIVRGDSHSLQFNDEKDDGIANYEFVMDALDEVASADLKFLMFHHPLSTYGVPGEEVIQGDAERNAIISKLQSIGAAAHFHGHLHFDKYDKTGDLHHIGTTEAVGDNPGFRIVNIANNEMINFSYVPANLTAYYAPSNPIGGVKEYFQVENDGTQTSQAAAIRNCFNQDFKNAHLRFYMQNGPSYQLSGGILYNSYIQDGIQVLDVVYNLKRNSTRFLSVYTETPIEFTDSIPVCPPITVPPPQVPQPPFTSTTTTTTTTTGTASGFFLIELLLGLGMIPLIHRSTSKKKK